jgi:hypothetical protein
MITIMASDPLILSSLYRCKNVRWHVHVASHLLLAHHYREVLAGGLNRFLRGNLCYHVGHKSILASTLT